MRKRVGEAAFLVVVVLLVVMVVGSQNKEFKILHILT
jgi:hypothetical protein